MDPELISEDKIRTFAGGATRDAASDKLDFEGFLSPLALEVYAKYMHKHRKQSDGNLRDSDNWQSGFGLSVVLKSAWRHLFDWWKIHRGIKAIDIRSGQPVAVKDAVCGVIFNAFCYLHELEKAELKEAEKLTPHPSVANFIHANGPQSLYSTVDPSRSLYLNCQNCGRPLNEVGRSVDRHRICSVCRPDSAALVEAPARYQRSIAPANPVNGVTKSAGETS